MSATVSICVPVYNGEAFIADALGSALEQTYEDLEVVVVDNRSTDRTAEIVEGLGDERVRLVRCEDHVDVVANWNRAIDAVGGRYVKLLCADDALAPTCLERQVAALEGHPQAALAASRRDVVDEEGRVLVSGRGLAGMAGYVDGREAIVRCLRTGTNPLGEPAAVLMRGEALRAAGPWSGAMPYMIDLEMWLRLLERGGLVAVPSTEAIFRVQGGSWSVAVSADQATQSRELIRAWRRRPGSPLSRGDVLLGFARAEAMRWGRRIVYTSAFQTIATRRAHRREN